MLEHVKTLSDPAGHVHKLIFQDETAIAECVAYSYEDRGVVCFSVQSGCPIGCTFCGTGKRFIRNLRVDEMHLQVNEALKTIGPKTKLQFMSMSMGEPMLNSTMVTALLHMLINEHGEDVHFYISSVGIDDPFTLASLLELGKRHQNFGLQFSLHHWDNVRRMALLNNHPQLLPLKTLVQYGKLWTMYTGKPCYWNYICDGSETMEDATELVILLGRTMHLTCSVLCNKKDFVKADPEPAQEFARMVLEHTHAPSVSVFDPAGQDTIGGGCGQLLYVQERMKALEGHDSI
jgi:23S rRNA (adenine2503-C2)-methyltransferase